MSYGWHSTRTKVPDPVSPEGPWEAGEITAWWSFGSQAIVHSRVPPDAPPIGPAPWVIAVWDSGTQDTKPVRRFTTCSAHKLERLQAAQQHYRIGRFNFGLPSQVGSALRIFAECVNSKYALIFVWNPTPRPLCIVKTLYLMTSLAWLLATSRRSLRRLLFCSIGTPSRWLVRPLEGASQGRHGRSTPWGCWVLCYDCEC